MTAPPGHGADDAIFAPFRQAAERPFVVAQIGQSLDGRTATLDGESKYINRFAALDHLHRLRAHVDAVVVGVGTVVADDPLLTVRRVRGRSPARVIIDPCGRLPSSARCLTEDGARRLVVRAVDAPVPRGVEVVRLPARHGTVDPAEVAARLFGLGCRRILIEGGPCTLSRFLHAGAVDRLHVLVSPMLIGSGRPGLTLPPVKSLAEAARPVTRVFMLADGDVLFDCDMTRREAEPCRQDETATGRETETATGRETETA